MVNIDREKLRDNILYFASIKGLKIGDIERSIDRSVGTISRWKNNNTKSIPIDDIYNIAILLDMTIDDLINSDIEELKKEQERIKKKQEILKLKEQREALDREIKYLESECIG